jgi:excisionase family DNA binding protein
MSSGVHSGSPLFTSKEAAERLHVSRSTVWKLVREGKLTPVKIGSSTRFDPMDLDALIEGAKVGG